MPHHIIKAADTSDDEVEFRLSMYQLRSLTTRIAKHAIQQAMAEPTIGETLGPTDWPTDHAAVALAAWRTEQ